jgi:pimeloyl-ACP methyl ester carboxylesterase
MNRAHTLPLLLLLWSLPIAAQDARVNSEAAVKSSDTSRHKSSFVTANGIKLHYLDWGGSGDVLLLLAGQGYDAHVFDGFAEKFIDRYHVIALTRRGVGESAAPKSGYDTATRVKDIREFLDVLKIKKATIVGHSMAGSEMTTFAIRNAKRVDKLVYLDAASDQACYAKAQPDPWLPPAEKNIRLELRSSSKKTTEVPIQGMPIERWAALKATSQAVDSFQPNYKKVKAPALAIYRQFERYDAPPGTPEIIRREMDAWWMKNGYPCAIQSLEQFRVGMRHGEIVKIQSDDHNLFVGSAQNEVVSLMREFLSKKEQ